MTRSGAGTRALAVALAFLAGYVDAVGFLHLGGFFISFMTGNSTRFGASLALGSGRDAAMAGGLILAFVLGVAAASLLGHAARDRRAPAILGFVAALLASAGGLARFDLALAATATMALAMGGVNAVFERDDDIPFGVTYMTGALVKVGQRLALALRGGPPFGFLPNLLLWAGLVLGVVTGALAYPVLRLDSLWPAGAGAALLAVIALSIRTPPPAS